MIHLDTNVLVRAMIPGTEEARRLADWIRDGKSVEVSALVWSEFLCGPLTTAVRSDATVLFPNVVAFSRNAASLAADLFNVD